MTKMQEYHQSINVLLLNIKGSITGMQCLEGIRSRTHLCVNPFLTSVSCVLTHLQSEKKWQSTANDIIHPWRLTSLLPRVSFFLWPAWLIVSQRFCQQRIPQETKVIKKYWCWIHLFAFPKWSLAKCGCSHSSLYRGTWRLIHILAAGLSQHFPWWWLH